MDISVIVCTRNRADSLQATLECLKALDLPLGMEIELILVDNNSTDHTPVVMAAFEWPGVEVRPIHVATPGVHSARNGALSVARGRVMLFTDDDVRPEPDWLVRMVEPILSGHADAVAGGINIPEDRRPAGLDPIHLEWFASTTHWGSDHEAVLVGANMAVARRVFESLGTFEPDLPQGDDTLLSCRLVAAGFLLQARYDLVVQHLVSPSRFTRKGIERQARLRGDCHGFFVRHWEGATLRVVPAHWLASWLRLQWFRIVSGVYFSRALPRSTEMVLMQKVAFWRAYHSRQNEPIRFDPVTHARLAPAAHSGESVADLT